MVLISLFFYHLLSFTWRKTLIIDPQSKSLIDTKQPVVFTSWHQYNLTLLFLVKAFKPLILSSPSLDGKLLAFIYQKLGGDTVWGSSRKRPLTGFREMLRKFKSTKRSCLFALDGPTGPRHKIKYGAIEFSKLTHTPIIPIGAYSSSKWILKKTWDLTEIPKPFSHVSYYFGPPLWIKVSENKKSSDLRSLLGHHMDNAQQKACENI